MLKFFHILSLITRRPTTDRALSSFTKALVELKAVVLHENEQINKLDAQIDKAAKNRLDAFTRQDRADRIKGKVAEFVL